MTPSLQWNRINLTLQRYPGRASNNLTPHFRLTSMCGQKDIASIDRIGECIACHILALPAPFVGCWPYPFMHPQKRISRTNVEAGMLSSQSGCFEYSVIQFYVQVLRCLATRVSSRRGLSLIADDDSSLSRNSSAAVLYFCAGSVVEWLAENAKLESGTSVIRTL